MSWKKTRPMTDRRSFIELYQTRLWSMTELCTRFDISRNTGDKWLRRDSQEGFSGLQAKSRALGTTPRSSTRGMAWYGASVTPAHAA